MRADKLNGSRLKTRTWNRIQMVLAICLMITVSIFPFARILPDIVIVPAGLASGLLGLGLIVVTIFTARAERIELERVSELLNRS